MNMNPTLLLSVLLVAAGTQPTQAFFSTNPATTIPTDLSFVPPDTSTILEDACKETAQLMKRAKVPISKSVSQDETVGISYVHWPAATGKSKLPPVVMVHGFDSSCLEYRRLGSKLAAKGIDAYAVDILGWGYTQLEGIDDFSATAKVEALNSFVTTVVGPNTEFCVAGASLGGAAAIELASSNENCKGMVLIDAQGFVDGVGPMASLPKFLAQAGVAVLKSVPLRSSANQMSYFDKETFATDDAVVIGRLHCVQQGDKWNDAMVSFMKSGGFKPSTKVPTIEAPSLVLWGRQDGILDGEEFANKFIETLPNAELKWIEECGHVPHLEKAEETAQLMEEFLASKVSGAIRSGSAQQQANGSNPFAEAASKLFQMN